MIEPLTHSDPESPLRWTCKSARKLAVELSRNQHPVSARTVCELLHQAGYSLQANCKTREGREHPGRNSQFEFINSSVRKLFNRRQPAISVDTKKKELVGDFKNSGQEWRPKGKPEIVRTHDFPDRERGKAIPYGSYDLLNNQGWVNVGIDHDTARFEPSVCTIRSAVEVHCEFIRMRTLLNRGHFHRSFVFDPRFDHV